jgi:hypothetical protein
MIEQGEMLLIVAAITFGLAGLVDLWRVGKGN